MEKVTKTVAICGTAGSSRHMIDEQPPEVELWGLNTSYTWMPRIDRLFDIHMDVFTKTGGVILSAADVQEHIKGLQALKCPIYMVDHFPHIPNSIRYPIEEVLEGGRFKPYFTSSIAYMMALAIHERLNIKLLGVDMKLDSEYAYQREALLYWQGVAEGLGLTVEIPDVSPLADTGPLYGRTDPLMDPTRAIRDWKDRVAHQKIDMVTTYLEKAEKSLIELRRNLDACEGAHQMCDNLLGKRNHGDISDNTSKGRVEKDTS